MKTFYISVTETLNRIVEVHAEDSSEALQKAEDAYYNGEIELDYDEGFMDEEDAERLIKDILQDIFDVSAVNTIFTIAQQ